MSPSQAAGSPDERVRQVAAAYDDDAVSYRDHWAQVLRGPGEALIEALRIQDATRILDIAAGVGGLGESLRRSVPHARVIAVDRSEGMLRLAGGYHGRALMDASRLAVLSGSFDAALLCFALFHFVEPVAALAEARRVLRPAGALGVTVWGDMLEYEALRVVKQELDNQGAPELPPILAQHELMNTPAKLEELLGRAGFTDTAVWSKPLDYQAETDAFMARFALRSLRRRTAALEESKRAACLARVRERLSSMEPEGFLDRTPVIYATARG
ncbi:MAG: methyltransferase domain-containing protein [Acidobacteriota bacterium]